MMQINKYVLLPILIFITNFVLAQNEINILIEKLDKTNNAIEKCELLSDICEIANNNELEFYNKQLYQIANSNLKKLKHDDIQYRKYLSYIEIAVGNRGYIEDTKGNNSAALFFYNAALNLAITLNINSEVGNCYNNIAFIYSKMGNVVQALHYYQLSLKVYEQIEDKVGSSLVLSNIAMIYEEQSDFKKALEYYQKSMDLRSELNDKIGVVSSYNNLAVINERLGNIDTAMNHYNKGLQLSIEIGNAGGTALILNNIGYIYLLKDSLESALTYFKKSKKLRDSINDISGIANSHKNLALTYFRLKDFSAAKSNALKAIQISKELGEAKRLKEALNVLYQIYLNEMDYKSAMETYQFFIMMRDSLFNQETQKASITSQIKYQFDKKATADSVRVSEEKKVIAAQLEASKTKGYLLYGGISMLAIFSLFVIHRYKETKKQKLLIEQKEIVTKQQKSIIEEKHKEITDSINYAERIQRSLLASKQMLDENLGDYFVFFKPKDVVSGDFYWASSLKNNQSALITADSTGHGVPGAIMSILNIACLNEAVKEGHTLPNEILNRTRKEIINVLKRDGSAEGGKDGMDCSLLVFNKENNVLQIAAANNPVWIVRNTEVIEIKHDKMPVGKHDKQDIPFTLHEIQLQKGDVIYTLTDGFPDQFGGEKGKKFMSKKLRELLAANAHLPMHEQKQLLETTFANWKKDVEQVDDVTIIGVRV